ncbi:hypothetical protein DL96DRAFT_1708555 [Flagelloscypha sp. PMI_526]|nr:hypothetical protein DL96DRAFT_1708555 [Flagelloscypha sp. PMI_526]
MDPAAMLLASKEQTATPISPIEWDGDMFIDNTVLYWFNGEGQEPTEIKTVEVNPTFLETLRASLKQSHRSPLSPDLVGLLTDWEPNPKKFRAMTELQKAQAHFKQTEDGFSELTELLEQYNALPELPLPILPVDVVREVCQLVPHECSGLSRNVQAWLDPILFRHVVIDPDFSGSRLLEAFKGQSSPPSMRMMHAAKFVISLDVQPRRRFSANEPEVEETLPPEIWKGLTAFCPNLNTVLLCHARDYDHDLPTLENRRLPLLRRMHCHAGQFMAATSAAVLAAPIYMSLTHLSLIIPWSKGLNDVERWQWHELSTLVNLIGFLLTVSLPRFDYMDFPTVGGPALDRVLESVFSCLPQPSLKIAIVEGVNSIAHLKCSSHKKLVHWIPSFERGSPSYSEGETSLKGFWGSTRFWEEPFWSHALEFVEKRDRK